MGFNFSPYLTKTTLRLARCPSKSFSRTRISSRKARTTFQFQPKYGLFEFARIAFGLCNSPATYARVIDLVLRGWNWKVVLAFLDDILVLEKDFEGHLANLRVVLVRYGLKLKPIKCELFQKEVEFLGRRISGG
jgi:hypothetical protein